MAYVAYSNYPAGQGGGGHPSDPWVRPKHRRRARGSANPDCGST